MQVVPSDATGLLFYERRMMRQELLLHELIRSHTTIPVAQIAVADFSRACVDQDYLLMTVLLGIPPSDVVLDADQRH